MFAVALIVFRETLEAALIVSIVLAASVGVPGRGRWVAGGVTSGVLGAIVVALFAAAIADTFAGNGQELLNAAILGLAVCMLAWHNIWMASHARELEREARALGRAVETGARPVVALAVITGAAVLREGSETVLFLFSVAASSSEGPGSFVIGGLAGLAGGAAIGAGMYFGLLRIPMRALFAVVSLMVLFLAAGLAAQCVSFLAQADLVPSLGEGLWDTSFLLDEGSIPGKILHTLIGYSARPSGIQLLAWVATFAAIGVPMWLIRGRGAAHVAIVAVSVAGVAGLVRPSPAAAQPAMREPAPLVASADSAEPGFFTGIWRRDSLLGDAGGLRTALGRYGITVQLTDVEEWLGNATGGFQRGITYDALTTLTVQLDTRKAFGWEGGLFNISGFQIRGRSLSQFYLGNLQTVSGISATPTTRLWEIWYQQSFLAGKFDVKLGQQSLDQEFMASTGSALYLNTMMGWPMVPSADLYAGGPAYPLSSLGVRLRGSVGPFTVLGGVFQDNPPGGPFADDSQLRGSTRWGGNFNLRTGALFIAEVQFALNQPVNGEIDYGGRSTGLPGTYKLGVWFDTASFPDQRFDTTGLSLADPASNGIPGMIRRNYSFYGVMDQVIWQPDPEKSRALAVFVRAMGAPGDRNLINFSVNAGVNLKAPLPGRDDDTFGIGFGFTTVGGAVRGLDSDTSTSAGGGLPVRSSETFIEVTYQAQVTPWLQVQPDFQFIHRPGAGASDPNNPHKRIRDEAVFGVRSNITF